MAKSTPAKDLRQGRFTDRLAGWARWKYFPVLCLGIWCLVGALMRSGPSMTVLTTSAAETDFMTPFSGAWALASGMHIHTDFSTPLGLAFYLPYYWFMEMFGNTPAVARHVQSAIFIGISIISFLLLRPPRFSWMITVLGTVFCSLLAACPGLLGTPPTVIYESSPNYLGLVAGYLCLLVAIFPPTGEAAAVRRRDTQDGLLLAAILVWTTFIKTNYLAQNATFILLAFIVSRLTHTRRSGRFYLALGVGFLAMALAFVVIFQVNLSAMMRDVGMAAACRSNWTMAMLPISDSMNNGHYLGLTAVYLHLQRALFTHHDELLLLVGLVFGGVAAVAIQGRTSLWRVALFSGLMVFVVIFDMLQGCFNSYGDTLPLLPLPWFFLLCVLERGDCIQPNAPTVEAARQTRGWVTGLTVVVVCCYTTFVGVSHVAAFVYNSGLSKHISKKFASADIQWDEHFEAKGWEQLYYTRQLTPGQTEHGPSFVAKMNMALKLVRENHLDKKRIFVFDQINPFPFLLQAPYPGGQPAWLHVEATFNSTIHLPAETILRGTEAVLVPKQPLNVTCLKELSSIYAGYVNTNFVGVADSDYWLLLEKNDGQRSVLLKH